MEEVRREREAKENKAGEQSFKRGLLTTVAATSSGELVAHACIISSQGQVCPFALKLSAAFLNLIPVIPSSSTIKVIFLIFFFQRLGFWRTCLLTHPIGGKVGSFEKIEARVVNTLRNVLHRKMTSQNHSGLSSRVCHQLISEWDSHHASSGKEAHL